MSWLFSRVLVEDCLERKRLDCEPYALLNWIGTADAFLHSDRMSGGYEVFSRYGMTFVPLTADRGVAALMSLLEGFRVRHLARRLEGATMRLTSGLRCVG